MFATQSTIRMLFAGLSLFVAVGGVRADDWPAHMFDNARGGVTSAALTLPLNERWVYRPSTAPTPAWPPPQPGWTELPKVDFDDAFYTVADKDAVYFGSSVDHQIHALDAATGRERWSFFTAGPVRNAPTLANGKLYAGSDDGKVYCLKREDGSQVWTHDAAANTRKVFGNGHAISLWPVRTGVLVEGGQVYFGAGIFPYYKPSLISLKAGTGELVWKSDAVTAYGGFSPQGYLLSTSAGIIVPSGRTAPVCVSRADGKLLYEIPHATEKGAATGCYGIVADDTLFVGTQNTLYGFKGADGTPGGKWLAAEKMLTTPEHVFLLKGPPAPAYGRKGANGGAANDITCINRDAYRKLEKKDAEGLKKVTRWRFPRANLASMILAGPHLIAGGEDEVIILEAATGKEVAKLKVDGLAVGLSVAHQGLIVSTTKGIIHYFGVGEAKKVEVPAKVPTNEKDATLAKGAVKEAGVTSGFALIVGPGSARYACELAKLTELTIHAIELDAKNLPDARRNTAAAGLYGSRVIVEHGSLDRLPFPDYGANLVVVLDAASIPPTKELLRILKPCGGVLLAPIQEIADETALKAAGTLTRGSWLKLIRGELKGSGWWTHQFADSGNSGSSADLRIKGRLDVLWFGEPGADEFPDRHLRGAAPLVYDGKVFCQGWNFLKKQTTLFCFDAYNGQRLWKRDIEGQIRLNLPAASGNLACGADGVFMAAGSKCYHFDAATGKNLSMFETPANDDGGRPDWEFLAVADGLVFGSSLMEGRANFSDTLFAHDIKTGKLKWSERTKEVRDTTLSVSGGRFFYVENRNPPVPPKKLLKLTEPASYKRTVVARDAATGKLAWEKETDLTHCGGWDKGVWGTLQMLVKDDVLILAGAYTIYAGSKATEENPRYAVALATKDGTQVWSTSIANRSRPVIMQGSLLAEPYFLDLSTGEKILKKVGTKMVAWSMGPRTGGCGSLSASECMVFGRGGYSVWRDVTVNPMGSAGGAFVGMRPGCFINMIPAGGVVVQAEASSGCSCYQAVQCTIVFRPALGE